MKFARTGVNITLMIVKCLCTEEEVKRYLPEKLCGWALDALNYLPYEFWKPDQKYRAWTLQETLYFLFLRLSKFAKLYGDAFERYLIEWDEYEKLVLQCEIDRSVFQSDVVDRKELASKEKTRDLNFKVEQTPNENFAKISFDQKASENFFD